MWLFNVARVLLTIPMKLVFPTKVYGKKPLPEGRCIVASNHLSGFDALVMAVNFKRNVTFLCKEELAGNWFTKWLFKSLGCVPIARGGNDFSAMKKILGTLEAEKAVALYPEGTRNKTAPGELLPFKTGVSMFALRTGSDIMPVILHSKPKAFKRNYLLIGDLIKVEKPEGRLNAEVLEKFTAEFQDTMQKQLDELKTRVKTIEEGKKLNRGDK